MQACMCTLVERRRGFRYEGGFRAFKRKNNFLHPVHCVFFPSIMKLETERFLQHCHSHNYNPFNEWIPT